ncbi:uncharacterized protein RAG0_09494 [Rhynchosporium agropyri]|uniref:Uncharacterized protein n=2 Tax=Rhynchosporium TaxID=38037 RepID=A0A1E1M015_RHYSE|nr:uncharacterized protein RAG0_09494 [Rhynchosporium agropyri]CZT41885.1 uncharacterized protein RSE6_01690 [Rhynchosporium secalis]
MSTLGPSSREGPQDTRRQQIFNKKGQLPGCWRLG